jgi:molybdenum cofactor cytidylyltransferase
MGEPKGLVVFEGRPWIETQLDALAGRRVVVVLGQDRARYLEALPALGPLVVANPDPDRGPFSSLQVGLGLVAPGPAFVLPVDVPAPSPSVWASLEDALRPDADAVLPVFDGRGGHPVLLAASFIPLLLSRDPSSRLDRELAAARAVRVPVDDPRVRLNLNAPEDWGKLRRIHAVPGQGLTRPCCSGPLAPRALITGRPATSYPSMKGK